MSVYTRGVTRKPFLGLDWDAYKPLAAAILRRRATLFRAVMVAALLAFELFNYSTTDFALTDLLGDLNLAGLRWATILALAFCGMDFAGLAWLFTPKRRFVFALRSWYLMAAWFLAATMNAMLTWWSVSLALLSHETLGNELITRQSMLLGAPVFVAALVWLLRVLLIGSFTLHGAAPQAASQVPQDASQGASSPPASAKRSLRLVPQSANGRSAQQAHLRARRR